MKIRTSPGTGCGLRKYCDDSMSETSSGGSLLHPQIFIKEALLGQISHNSLKWNRVRYPPTGNKALGERNSIGQGGAGHVWRVEIHPRGPGVTKVVGTGGHWLDPTVRRAQLQASPQLGAYAGLCRPWHPC